MATLMLARTLQNKVKEGEVEFAKAVETLAANLDPDKHGDELSRLRLASGLLRA